MQLNLTTTVPTGTDPDDPTILSEIGYAVSRQATAWTEPVYSGQHPSPDMPGYTVLTYVTDAVPRTGAVTTDNVAPALLPPQ